MKIAIFTERMKTGFGVDLVVHEQALRLSRNHDVAVFAIEKDDEFVSNVPYSVYQLNIPLAFNPLKQDINTFNAWKNYKSILSMFDTFIIHTPTYNSWVWFLKSYGHVIFYYYGNSPSYGYAFPKNQRSKIFGLLENNVYFKQGSHIISISSFLKSGLKKSLQNKTIVSHLGKEHITKCAKTITVKDISEFKRKYFINENEKIITYIGRLNYQTNPYKNTQEILDISKEIKKKHKDASFLMIGIPENGIEKEFYRSGIRVITRAPLKDLVIALMVSYAYISPSKWEGFNLPLLEAQSVGTPVVAYNIGAHNEVVSDGKSGYLVRDQKVFIERLAELIKDGNLRYKLSKGALEYASNFSWDKNVSELERIINKLYEK